MLTFQSTYQVLSLSRQHSVEFCRVEFYNVQPCGRCHDYRMNSLTFHSRMLVFPIPMQQPCLHFCCTLHFHCECTLHIPIPSALYMSQLWCTWHTVDPLNYGVLGIQWTLSIMVYLAYSGPSQLWYTWHTVDPLNYGVLGIQWTLSIMVYLAYSGPSQLWCTWHTVDPLNYGIRTWHTVDPLNYGVLGIQWTLSIMVYLAYSGPSLI